MSNYVFLYTYPVHDQIHRINKYSVHVGSYLTIVILLFVSNSSNNATCAKKLIIIKELIISRNVFRRGRGCRRGKGGWRGRGCWRGKGWRRERGCRRGRGWWRGRGCRRGRGCWRRRDWGWGCWGCLRRGGCWRWASSFGNSPRVWLSGRQQGLLFYNFFTSLYIWAS